MKLKALSSVHIEKLENRPSIYTRVDECLRGASKRVDQFSLTISSQKGLTEFQAIMRGMKKDDEQNKIKINHTIRLTIDAQVEMPELMRILRAMPKLQELALRGNLSIAILPILRQVPLQKLTLDTGCIYFDPGEKDLILEEFPVPDLKILLGPYPYEIDQLSTRSIAFQALLIFVTLAYASYVIDSVEKDVRCQSRGLQMIVLPLERIWFPILLYIFGTIELIQFIAWIFRVNRFKAREVIRLEPLEIEPRHKSNQRTKR